MSETTTHQQKIEQSRAAVDSALARLAEALRQGKPQDLVRYLEFWGAFPRYSFHNAMLILSQKPDATRVAGFRAWHKVGRYVRRGERGIAILYPRVRAREDDETGERFLAGFGVGYVFDVASTDGEPLPERPAWREKGPANAGDVERIAAAIRAQGVRLIFNAADVEALIKGADGVTYRGEDLVVAVRDDLEAAHTVRTLLHEFGHAVLHFDDGRPDSREQRELEADAVAVAVAAALGYDFNATAYHYLSGWDATAEGLGIVLPRIGRGVQTILQALGLMEEEQ